MSKTQWSVSDTSNAQYMGVIEFQDDSARWHIFELLELPNRLVFGGSVNVGFMESGYILRDASENVHTTYQELLADLEVYYNDGPQYVSRIVCSERM